jgi:hypothetical protein
MDLRKLNSITKYPSILTYHQIGEKGRLTERYSEDKTFPYREDLYIYEKVDGENSRIILLNTGIGDSADYIIGSREELLFAKGDRIGNPYGNISELLSPIADNLGEVFKGDYNHFLTVIYQESYGGKTKASKNYTNNKKQDYKVFDVFSLSYSEFIKLMNASLESIARWRDSGNQPFYYEDQKQDFINEYGLSPAPLLEKTDVLPWSIEDTYNYLNKFKDTKAGIDAHGKSEGIIVRTHDRKMIRKIRFEDYERTLRK